MKGKTSKKYVKLMFGITRCQRGLIPFAHFISLLLLR
uniref:Uncharacterized protein n=1 Tax=Anguilla anguilla TaxID=7936 RepID=A0A0E9XU78_ANGAN